MSDKTCVNMTSFTAHQSLIILVIKKKGLNLHDYLKLRLTAASFIPLSAVKKNQIPVEMFFWPFSENEARR